MNFKRAVLTLVVACFVVASLAAASPSFDEWTDAFVADWMRLNPQRATQIQYFSGAEQDALDRQLVLASVWQDLLGVRGAHARAELARRGLRELQQFPAANLTPQQRISAATLKWYLEVAVAREPFAHDRFIFEQFGGIHIGLVTFLTTMHPIRNARDVENYLARLARVAPVIDEGIAEAKSAADAGFLPPRFVLQRVQGQLETFLAPAPDHNPLVTTLATRMAAVQPALSAADRDRFLHAAAAEISATIVPAYRRVRALIADQLPHATDDAGLWTLPDGAAAYREALHELTNTDLSPDEIHAIGLREVARIEGEMDAILRPLGYREGTVLARYTKLCADRALPAKPDPRPQLLAQAESVIRDAEKRSALIFDRTPRSPVIVRREPALTEKSAAAHYTPPAPDGSKPGIFWLPLPEVGPDVLWIGAGLKTTAYHEAVPGHHFQLSLEQENAELPRFQKLGAFGVNSAFAEGWALYAERLVDESHWYEGDPFGRLGYLRMQLMRAQRLVVDTGLHAQKWTRQQAIDYGFPASEVERYVVWPGQACSYMIGELRLVELRDKARAALGPKFSLQRFHDVVLRGTVPLDVLGTEIDDWIAAQR